MFQCFTTLALKQGLGPYLPFAWSVTLRKWHIPLKGNGGGESHAKNIAPYSFCSVFAQMFLFFSFLFFILKAEGDWRRKSGTRTITRASPCKPRRVYTEPSEPEIIFVVCAKTFKLCKPYTGKNYLDSNCDSARFIKIISFIGLE